MTTATTGRDDADLRVLHRRLVVGYVVLAVVWGVSFNVESLPFFPTVVIGGGLTGLFGVWARRVMPADRRPPLRVSPRHAALAVVVALAHLALGQLLFRIGDAFLPAMGESASRVYERTSQAPIVPRIILSGLITASLEEVFWRGAFHPAVRDRSLARWPTLPPMLVAVAVSTAGYTLFHVSTLKPSLVAAAALGGLIWAWLLERTRSLGATMIAHGLWTSLMVMLPVV